ncbi:MAG: L-seryl-tRNA(Sec) selenium transferase [Armatimonadota bacterium]
MNRTDASEEYRKLPSVDELLRDERAVSLLSEHSRRSVADGLRAALDKARIAIADGFGAPEEAKLFDMARTEIENQLKPSLRRAINATGVIVHTGLGRSVMCREAVDAVTQIAQGHSTLEIEVETGKRGSRQEHVSGLLTELTGAESALAVNNNAAAVLLAINTLAQGREVVISRSQLVEIGGAFRMPDIIRRSGARMVEVGTTNRTRISDYESAITDDTAIILRCHPSNFKISGFVEEASLEELVGLGRRLGIPVVDDLGSGALIDVSKYGLDYEPTVQASVKAGASLICFSGDKLLGASQAGILIGNIDLIDSCRHNPLARALRVDKLTLAALEATLRVYRYSDPMSLIPTLFVISRPLDEIELQARRLVRRIISMKIPGLKAHVETTLSETGGGSLPGQNLESRAVALKSDALSADDLGEHFRRNEPPIFGRISRDTFLLDMRTVTSREVSNIFGCVEGIGH